MTTYAWPSDWWPAAFELRVKFNTRLFVGAYTPAMQAIDLLGERWVGRIDLRPARPWEIAAREAFIDRLRGQANSFNIWHFGRPAALGTIGAGQVTVPVVNASAVTVPVVNASAVTVPCVAGDPAVRTAIEQNAGTAVLQTRAGRTVQAGDMLGLGSQTVRVLADATADGGGLVTVEFAPRARQNIPAYTAVVTAAPLIRVRLKGSDGVPTTWQPGYADGASFEFTEDV